jgi:hypothetical protein
LTLLGRAAFAATFFGLELGGIAWGQRAPDHVAGFQMFNESSRLSIQLFRETRKKGKRVLTPLPDGSWKVRAPDGSMKRYSWRDRVKVKPLYVLGEMADARYGLDAQLFRLQAALDDFVRHTPDDAAMTALVAEVTTSRNGAPGHVTLRAERP